MQVLANNDVQKREIAAHAETPFRLTEGQRATMIQIRTLPPRAQAWGMTRYQAYQDRLAGRTIGEIFRLAAAFLTLTAANAGSLTDLANADAPGNGPGQPQM